jgi:hypothetical protein
LVKETDAETYQFVRQQSPIGQCDQMPHRTPFLGNQGKKALVRRMYAS